MSEASSSPVCEWQYRSSPGSAALSFSFGIFSFVSRQKKSTPTSIIHIKKIRIFCPFLLYIS
ncbi:hypothetical protein DWW88_17945 [Bacteroides cellulosilyticus]|nr:hypothetical protein DWW88_17945 [Bacteroides cellulosilyticus]